MLSGIILYRKFGHQTGGLKRPIEYGPDISQHEQKRIKKDDEETIFERILTEKITIAYVFIYII